MFREAFEAYSLGPRNTEPTSKFNIEAFGYTFAFPPTPFSLPSWQLVFPRQIPPVSAEISED